MVLWSSKVVTRAEGLDWIEKKATQLTDQRRSSPFVVDINLHEEMYVMNE